MFHTKKALTSPSSLDNPLRRGRFPRDSLFIWLAVSPWASTNPYFHHPPSKRLPISLQCEDYFNRSSAWPRGTAWKAHKRKHLRHKLCSHCKREKHRVISSESAFIVVPPKYHMLLIFIHLNYIKRKTTETWKVSTFFMESIISTLGLVILFFYNWHKDYDIW